MARPALGHSAPYMAPSAHLVPVYVAEATDEVRLEHSDDDDEPLDNSDLFTPPAIRPLSLVAPVPVLSLPLVPSSIAASNLSSEECLTLINQWNALLPVAERIPTHDPLVLFRDACDVLDRMKRLDVPMLGLEAIPEGLDAYLASLPDSSPDSPASAEPAEGCHAKPVKNRTPRIFAQKLKYNILR
jgi:hypothetical protein